MSKEKMNYCHCWIYSDNDSYRVCVKSHSKITTFMGEQRECTLIEKWCDCEVNGVKGWGAVEWQYKTKPNISKY